MVIRVGEPCAYDVLGSGPVNFMNAHGVSTIPVRNRFGAYCAIAGVAFIVISTALHTMHADPNDPAMAFAEYAADPYWTWSHIVRLMGFVLVGIALFFINTLVVGGIAGSLSALGNAGIYISVTLAAALQAVDGIALIRMVDRWTVASVETKQMVFEAVIAVRQIEIALASIVSLSFGTTIVIIGVACYLSKLFPRWLAFLGVIAGGGFAASGFSIAISGFSSTSMNMGMPSNMLLMIWLILLGVFLLKTSKV